MNHAKYVNVYTVLIDTYLFILIFLWMQENELCYEPADVEIVR